MERGSRLVLFPALVFALGPALAAVGAGCGGDVPDGTHFGFVHEASDGTLTFDPAEWLTGDEAAAAYREHGEEQDEPFYIDNPKVDSLRLPVDPGALFVLLAYDNTGTPALQKALSYDELARLWATGDDAQLMSASFGSYELGLPMHLTVSGGRVTGGNEQYVP